MMPAMKWTVRIITRRKRKYPFKVKASSIEELTDKLRRHAGKIQDLEIETPVNDPDYWKSLILMKLFSKTHEGTLF